jgi:DNA-binding IclR family transcriptional regulator
MKMRHLAVATSAALLSFGALAEGQQQSQGSEQRAPQAQSDSSTIRQAQEALRSRGYAATPQGLREFQQANAIEPSGMLDQHTLAALGVSASAESGASSGSGASSDTAPQRGERPKY